MNFMIMFKMTVKMFCHEASAGVHYLHLQSDWQQ